MFESSVTFPTSIFASVPKDTGGLFLLFNLMIVSIVISSILNNHKGHQSHHTQTQQELLSQNLQRAPSILQRLMSLNFYNFKPHEHYHHHNHHYPQSHHTDYVHEPQHSDENPNQFVRSSSFLQTLMSSTNIFNFKTHLPNPNTNQPNTTSNNYEQNYFKFDQTQEIGHSNVMENEHEEEVDEEPTLDEIYSRIRNQNNNRFHTINPNPIPPERPSFNYEVPADRLRKSASTRVSRSSSYYGESDSIENRHPASAGERRRMRRSEVDQVDERATDFINRFKQQLRLQRIESIKKYKNMIARGSGR